MRHPRVDLSAPTTYTKATSGAEQLACEIKSCWLREESPDAEAAFREHPELLADRAIALDLAYEEYCQRIEAGEQLDTDAYCHRFSALRYSLAKQLAVHAHLQQYSGALEWPLLNWPKVGDALLGFTLIEELGRGGFARVYLAREAALGDRPVVVKVTQQQSTEAQVLGRLRHRNVVPVYSVHHDPSTSKSAVCMPYLGRATLFELLDTAFAGPAPPARAAVILDVARQRSQPNTPDDGWHQPDRFLARSAYVDGIVHLIAQVAEALHHTHSQGICHGDLKPSNILLGWDGTPLLLDFNLSFDHHVADSALGGTIPYMSPEQLRGTCLGQRRDVPVDVRSDVFSLAVILYELLTGKEPFGRVSWKGSARQTAAHLLQQQGHGPRSLHSANPHVDQKLARVVERCLAVDPDDRLESAAELAVVLRRSLAPARRARRWVVRHRRLTTAAAAVLLLFCLCGVGYVATLPPRSEQALHAALADAKERDFDAVIDGCNRAIGLDPQCGQAFFLRGFAYKEMGDWSNAFYDFAKAEEILGDGRADAAAAYCAMKLGRHEAVPRLCRQAIDAGFESAAVYCNLGQALARSNDAKARVYLIEATQLDPHLQPAWHNLLVVEVGRSRETEWDPDEALSYLQRVWNTSHPNARMLLNAARLCDAAARERPTQETWIEYGIGFLTESVELGHKFSAGDFPHLRTDPRFAPLLARNPPSSSAPLPDRFVDPLRKPPTHCWLCQSVDTVPFK